MPPEHSRKRNRITLSCNYCKKRKVKCDRGQPCNSCIKYNVAGLCEYSRITKGENQQIGKLLPFPVQHTNNKNSQSKENHETTNEDEYHNSGKVQSELEMLKDKIRQIESSISLSSLPKPIYNVTTSPSNSHVFGSVNSQNYSPNQKLPHVSNGPIKLPPLEWRSPPSSTNGSVSNENNLKDGQASSNVCTPDYDSNTMYVGVNPYGSSDETINFYEGYSPVVIKSSYRRMNFGPFAWISIMNKDVALRLLWKYAMQRKRIRMAGKKELNWIPEKLTQETENTGNSDTSYKSKIIDPEVASLISQYSKQEKEFREKAFDREGYNDIRPYNNVLDGKQKEKEKKQLYEAEIQRKINMNKNAISLGLTVFEGQIDQELKLFDKIKVLLPKQKVIWILINKFFVTMYPFLPFVDETYFKLEMSRILGPEEYNDSKIDKLNIEKKLDLANIGILLLIIRFTYLSLFSNRTEVNENNLKSEETTVKALEMKYLLSNPVNIEVVHMAQLCLDQFDLLRKSNLAILQCALLMRLYHMFAPEEGDGADGGDSQIYTGMLIHMAYSMGLNREPENFLETCSDDKINNIGRKIFLFLSLSDFNQAYAYGNPLCIDDKYVDTKLPYYKPGNENICDVELEKNVLSTFAYFSKCYEKLKRILDLTLSVKNSIKMEELTTVLSDFEKFMNNHFGKLEQFFVPFNEDTYRYPFIKVMKCKNYINLSNFNMVIFFHLFLYYEKKKRADLLSFYLKKVYSLMLFLFIEGIFQLVGNNHINFGEGADLILNPSLEQIIHKSSQINYAILIRLKLQLKRMSSKEDHTFKLNNDYSYQLKHTKLTTLANYIQKLIEILMSAMSRLSNRYYFAWKVTKSYKFLLGLSGLDEFIQNESDVDVPEFSIGDVEDLSKMCEKTLRQLQESKQAKKDNMAQQEKEDEQYQYPDPNIDTHRGVAYNNIQADTTVPLTPGVSVKSGNSLSFEDLELVNDSEIDRLWMQMVSMKNDSNTNSEDNSTYDPNFEYLNLHPLQTPLSSFRSRSPFSNNGFGDNLYDFFRDNQLDQIFEGNY